jgi:hypothetical protein
MVTIRNRQDVSGVRKPIHACVQTPTIIIKLVLQSSFGHSPPLIFWFPDLLKHMVGLFGRVISPSQSLYPHRTTQHRKPRINIHALSGIRTSVRAIKARASDRAATGSAQALTHTHKYALHWQGEKMEFQRI